MNSLRFEKKELWPIFGGVKVISSYANKCHCHDIF